MALHGTNGRHRIYLMRHGEVSYFDADGKAVNPLAVTLTDKGQAQARAAGAALAEVPIDRVVCSGLPRTRETAELATEGRAFTIDEVPGLVEIKGGRFSDIPRDRMEAEIVYGFDGADQRGARFAGGELIADFEQRTVASLLDLLDQPDWTTLLVVAHDGVNRMLLGWACGAGLKAAPSFEQDMGCLDIIDVDIAGGETRTFDVDLAFDNDHPAAINCLAPLPKRTHECKLKVVTTVNASALHECTAMELTVTENVSLMSQHQPDTYNIKLLRDQ